MRNITIRLLVALLCIVCCRAQFVEINIDNFVTPPFDAQCEAPCTPVIESVSGEGILGGSRLIELLGDVGTIDIAPAEDGNGLVVGVTGVSRNSQYEYQLTATLIYDGNYYPVNPNGLGGVDLYRGLGEAFFQFVFQNSAERDFWSVNITVYSGSNNCTATVYPCTSGNTCVSVVSFTQFPNCDLNSVGAITVTFIANTNSTQSENDFILKSVSVIEQVSAITPSPSPSPSAGGQYNYVGNYAVNSGPSWTTNPPCYTCQQACALIFGGVSSSYHCSTVIATRNDQAFATTWGVPDCQTVADTYSLNTNYNCGSEDCSTSAYCMDNCYATNYCWQSAGNPTPTFQSSPTFQPSPSASPSPGGGGSLVGNFNVINGPSWTTNPPCYTCQQACALIFGGVFSSYHCSTVSTTMNEQAFTTSWGITGCQTVADTYSLNTNYNCGSDGCSTSAYCMDHCSAVNYCWLV